MARFPRERRAFAAALIDTAERASRAAFVPRALQAIGPASRDGDRRDFEQRLSCILHGDAEGRGGQGGRGLFAAGLLVAAASLPGLVAPTLAGFRGALPVLPAGIDEETWRVSLERAEERLRATPDDAAAVKQRGLALLGLGRLDEAVAAFRRQAEFGFQVANALYNEACAHARAGAAEAAIDCLARAAELGLDVPSYARADPDLEPLRAHPDFAALCRDEP